MVEETTTSPGYPLNTEPSTATSPATTIPPAHWPGSTAGNSGRKAVLDDHPAISVIPLGSSMPTTSIIATPQVVAISSPEPELLLPPGEQDRVVIVSTTPGEATVQSAGQPEYDLHGGVGPAGGEPGASEAGEVFGAPPSPSSSSSPSPSATTTTVEATPTQAPGPQEEAPTPINTTANAAATPACATSRTICLRTLTLPGKNAQTSSSLLSTSTSTFLAGWGGAAGGASSVGPAPSAPAPASTAVTAPPPGVEVAGGQPGTTSVGLGVAGAGVVSNGGGGVTPSVNKIVDLREVKKVRPGPLAAGAGVATSASEGSGSASADGEWSEEDSAGGLVKVDLSAGKRMIEFQLKVNAAEERREAARIKSEKERAGAAAAEESQRMLAQVNARIEAQRRDRGGVFGPWESDGNVPTAGGGCAHNGHTITQDDVRNLAERHGIVVKFVDEGNASGVAQVRALARAHGLRIRILGDGEEGGRCRSDAGGEMEEEGEEDGGTQPASRGGGATPPPVLLSLRPRPTAPARCPSPVPQAALKTPRKAPVAPAAAAAATREGGMFSGPARMMRMALQASGGCGPSKEASPVPARRGGDDAIPTSSEESKRGTASDDTGKKSTSPSSLASAESPPGMLGLLGKGQRRVVVPSDASAPPGVSEKPSAFTAGAAPIGKKSRPGLGLLLASRGWGSSSLVGSSVGSSSSDGDGRVANGGADAARRKRRATFGSRGEAVAAERQQVGAAEALKGAKSSRDVGAGAGVASLGDGDSHGHGRGPSLAIAGRKRREAPADCEEEVAGRPVEATEEKRATKSAGGGGAVGVAASGDARALGGKISGAMKGRLGPAERSGGPRGGGGGGGGSSVAKESLPARIRALPEAGSAHKRMRLVPASSGRAEFQPSAAAITPRTVRRASTGAGPWTPGNNNLFKGAMAGIIGRGKRPAP